MARCSVVDSIPTTVSRVDYIRILNDNGRYNNSIGNLQLKKLSITCGKYDNAYQIEDLSDLVENMYKYKQESHGKLWTKTHPHCNSEHFFIYLCKCAPYLMFSKGRNAVAIDVLFMVISSVWNRLYSGTWVKKIANEKFLHRLPKDLARVILESILSSPNSAFIALKFGKPSENKWTKEHAKKLWLYMWEVVLQDNKDEKLHINPILREIVVKVAQSLETRKI